MTWICYVGIELSAATQRILLSIEIITLALFAVVALVKVYAGGAGRRRSHIGLDWFSPFGLPGGSSALIDGVLLGVFIYWGWDSGVCVNEESEDSANGPGKAAVLSTLLLVLIYVVVAAAAQAYAGTEGLSHNKTTSSAPSAARCFGSPLDKLLIITVLTSASASTQTTILPTARTTLSMARFGAIPKAFGRIHPRYLTPDVSTLAMGGVSLVWTLFIINVSQNVLGDSITGLGFQIAFYYGLTGFACAIYYRQELFKSARNFFMVGVVPFLGGLMLTGIFVKAFIDNKTQRDTAYYTAACSGSGPPDAIGVGLLLFGAVLMVFANFVYPQFFRRKPETAPTGLPRASRQRACRRHGDARMRARGVRRLDGEIVVGYDGTECAKAALDEAVDLAKELGDKVVIVFGYAPGGYGGGEVPTQREAVEELGEKVTEEAHERAAAGVEHEIEMVNEHGAEALSDVANKRDARMIVVGTTASRRSRGRSSGRPPTSCSTIAEAPGARRPRLGPGGPAYRPEVAPDARACAAPRKTKTGCGAPAP